MSLWGLVKDSAGSDTLGMVIATGLTVLSFGLVAYALITEPKRSFLRSTPEQEPLASV